MSETSGNYDHQQPDLERVQVFVRCRPLSSKKFSNPFLILDDDGHRIRVQLNRGKGASNNRLADYAFTFDGVLNEEIRQEDCYRLVCSDIVLSALDGYNATVMCFGQTGAGKTYTISGVSEAYQKRGLLPRAVTNLFKEIERRSDPQTIVRVSYLEIYNEVLYDLLSASDRKHRTPLSIVEAENEISVRGLSGHIVRNEQETLDLLFEGEANRTIDSHLMNKTSSRSHCIFTVYLEAIESDMIRVSKLHFVDLAGSERLAKTSNEKVGNATNQRETKYINKSLSFLEQTVVALADRNRAHIPYRSSKLTHFLKDSLGGYCKTVLIANVWLDAEQIDETIATLKFSQRMMAITVQPVVRQIDDPARRISNLEQENRVLREQLNQITTQQSGNRVQRTVSDQDISSLRCAIEDYLRGDVKTVAFSNKEVALQIFKEIFSDLQSTVDRLDTDLRETKGNLQRLEHDFKLGSTHAPKHKGNQESPLRNGSKQQQSQQQPHAQPGLVREASYNSVASEDGRSSQVGSDYYYNQKSSHANGKSLVTRTLSAAGSTITQNEALEVFKRKEGAESHSRLKNLREEMKTKKQEYAKMAKEINQTKIEIDGSRVKLDALRAERELRGSELTAEGEVIISESEFVEIQNMQTLKERYHSLMKELNDVRSQSFYYQKSVEQARLRFLQEFEHWYAHKYLDREDDALRDAMSGDDFHVVRLPPV